MPAGDHHAQDEGTGVARNGDLDVGLFLVDDGGPLCQSPALTPRWLSQALVNWTATVSGATAPGLVDGGAEVSGPSSTMPSSGSGDVVLRGSVLTDANGGFWFEPASVPVRPPPSSLPNATTTAMTSRIDTAAP